MLALGAETGVEIGVAAVVERLAPPLDYGLGNWFPAEVISAMGERFRRRRDCWRCRRCRGGGCSGLPRADRAVRVVREV